MKFIKRVSEYTVRLENEPLFDINTTRIGIDDIGAGEYITISQEPDEGVQTVKITLEEWELIKTAVDDLMKNIE